MRILRNAMIVMAASITVSAMAEKVVILHTNDTHSQIDPMADGTGGVARRKVLIDSVRAVEPNVILIDAGDAVQGSLFFTFFKGEVEQKLMNLQGYDIQILGNHEFDNGLDALKTQLDNAEAELLSTNYNFDGTPLEGMFRPYSIRKVGDKRIGFVAININPKGLIHDAAYAGMEYLDAIEAANALAWYLRHVEKVDKVIAVTHIGYDNINGESDVRLASESRNIDIIIGGHSHTFIDPATEMAHVKNADGKDVLVLQTKSRGAYVGELTLDLDADTASARLIPVDKRLDSRADPAVAALLAPYRHAVDSLTSVKVGKAAMDFPQDSQRLLNLLSDYVMTRGAELAGSPVDLAIMNKGGIRNSLAKGNVTKGQIMNMLPFNNSIVVMDIKGSDLLENLEIMARQGGNGLSEGMAVSYDPATGKVKNAMLRGKPIDPESTYRLATISYLAAGGDYMVPLTRGKIVAESQTVIYNDIIDSLEHGSMRGKPLKASDAPRMTPAAE